MAKIEPVQQTFNVGVVDKDKLHRQDLLRVLLAAEEQTNLLGAVTGEMFMRPGLEYLSTTKDSAQARIWNYYRSETERAIFEFGDETFRVWVDDEALTRPAVTSSVTNPEFANAGGGWTLSDGAAMNGQLRLFQYARGQIATAKQQVSTSSAGIEHALRINVSVGPVTLRVGSTDGADDYVAETPLLAGEHSIAFTPSGAFWVQLSTDANFDRYVTSVNVESAGVVEIPTRWAIADAPFLRFDTSLDVVFVACRDMQQGRIERRGQRSWSVTRYVTEDGPFSALRPTQARLKRESDVTTRPPLTSASGNYSSDQPFFAETHIGGLLRIRSNTRRHYIRLGADNTDTESIRVTGVKSTDYNDRDFDVEVSGTWTGTLRTERSFDDESFGYRPFRREAASSVVNITANGSFTNEDEDDNAIVWYRIHADEIDSGAAFVLIEYEGQYSANVLRVTDVVSTTQVIADDVSSENFALRASFLDYSLISLGSPYTDQWEVSDWPFIAGWPTAVALHEGRLFWSGRDKLWGSISDAFDSFDDEFEGDAGPINRAIATSGSNEAQWMLSLEELIIGTSTSVVSARSSTQGEILTPADTTVKILRGSVGCAPVAAVEIGSDGLFVDATGRSVYLVRWEGAGYSVNDISKLTKQIFSSGVSELAAQRSPDPRIWARLDNGKLVCIVYDPGNEVLGFFLVETNGEVESIAVQQSTVQDRLYCVVKRTIGGSDVRYFEKMALDSDVAPSTLCKVMDSYVVATASGTTLSGLDHLEGATVVAWANGGPIVDADDAAEEFTVSSGAITLPAAYADAEVVVGLAYRGRYKSGRLGSGVEGYSPMLKKKRLVSLGMLMTDFVRAGVKFGSSFDDLDGLPAIDESGAAAQAIVLDDVRDEQPFSVDAGFDLDSRACVEVNSPFTAKFLAMRMGIETA